MTGPVVSGPKSPWVLDSSAVVAYLLREQGWETVQAKLAGGLLSTVNLCEIVSKFAEWGENPEAILHDVLALELTEIPFSAAHALGAARLRPQTRSLGLSLGDRACLALALERGATALTADAAWADLPVPHRIEVIR